MCANNNEVRSGGVCSVLLTTCGRMACGQLGRERVECASATSKRSWVTLCIPQGSSMAQPQHSPRAVVVKQRQKKAYKDPTRWRCPHPDCNRSFAVLWRLKVHYRAPVDARGSGVERGHGMELSHCPKCNAEFQEGRHHVNCSAGPTAGPPNPKRVRKRGAESSGSDGTVVKRPACTPSMEAISAPPQVDVNAALVQLLQSLVPPPPPPPTLEQQLLSTLLAVSAKPDESAMLAQLHSLLSGGVARQSL